MFLSLSPARMLRAAVAVAVLAVLGHPCPAPAQGKAEGVFLAEAFTRVTKNAKVANQLVGYGYNEGICIVGGWVDGGKSIDFTLPLNAGTSYMFIASGDNDARDVDVRVLFNGKTVASDVRVAADAIVGFKPRVNGRYTMRVTLFKSRNNLPCVCVAAVMRKGGWKVPLKNLDTCAGQIIQQITGIDNALRQKFNKRLYFRKGSNRWAVYGSVLRQGGIGSVDLSLARGLQAFLAVGDTQAQDVDIWLKRNGQKVKSDTKTNKTGFIAYNSPGGRYSLEMRNYRSRSPSLTMMAAFEVR